MKSAAGLGPSSCNEATTGFAIAFGPTVRAAVRAGLNWPWQAVRLLRFYYIHLNDLASEIRCTHDGQ